MTVERADILLVGGGIVGLATAFQLLRRTPDVRLALIEREPALAAHQSGRNSGVLHAGLYYAPGSLKARLCREGKAALESFAEAHAIPFRHTGKLVVAVDESELPRFEALRARAEANGVPGLEVMSPQRLGRSSRTRAGCAACGARRPASSTTARSAWPWPTRSRPARAPSNWAVRSPARPIGAPTSWPTPQPAISSPAA